MIRDRREQVHGVFFAPRGVISLKKRDVLVDNRVHNVAVGDKVVTLEPGRFDANNRFAYFREFGGKALHVVPDDTRRTPRKDYL
ncbi:hypothetical protein AGMMS49975_12990 [Clostridia bacterium]|nr:hypothetical protein AGMMS49975_12990 [Clostridia bacterium]